MAASSFVSVFFSFFRSFSFSSFLLLLLVFPPRCSFGPGFFSVLCASFVAPPFFPLPPCSSLFPRGSPCSVPVVLLVSCSCLFLVGASGLLCFWGPSLALEVVATLVDAFLLYVPRHTCWSVRVLLSAGDRRFQQVPRRGEVQRLLEMSLGS